MCLRSTLYKFEPTEVEHEFAMKFISTSKIYEGQYHVIHIKLKYGNQDDIYFYPINAPLCTFKTPIWHPNIDKHGSGIICLDTLKEAWNATMTIDNIYSMITLLLAEPNPDSPQNSEAAKQFIENRQQFINMTTTYYHDNWFRYNLFEKSI